jgi:ribosomal protein S18 acetylase RimI-like enzyme
VVTCCAHLAAAGAGQPLWLYLRLYQATGKIRRVLRIAPEHTTQHPAALEAGSVQSVQSVQYVHRLIEELTLNAWPALQTVLHDGWLLRLAGGYTRRANSVNPLYPSTAPLPNKVAYCEAVYSERGLATVFKLTEASEPTTLDAFLEQRGYAREATTSVQLAGLDSLETTTTDGRGSEGVTVTGERPDDWLDALHRWGGTPARLFPTIDAMLRAIVPATGYAALRLDGEIAAVGLGVVERGYVGLFDIATAPALRGRGLATRVVGRLLSWGRERGARTGHLAVMLDNEPALRLYARFGFREAYRYWYRVRR